MDLGREHVANLAAKSIKKRFFEKSCCRFSRGSNFEVLGVQVGSKKRFKIDQKMKPTWDGILSESWHRFVHEMIDFGRQVGGKIGRKSGAIKARNNIENLNGTRMRLGSVLEASWTHLGQSWEIWSFGSSW